MQTLATSFTDRTFRYTQLQRQGPLAIYTQEHKESGHCYFEVIRIRVQREHTWPNGDTTPEHEAYPGAGRWGQDGWTFGSLESAQAHLAALLHLQATLQPLTDAEEQDDDLSS